MTTEKLREWRGAKPVAPPAGMAVTTRLRTSDNDEKVLDALAEHLGRLRRSDLAAHSRPEPVDHTLNATQRAAQRRAATNARKAAMTAQSSSRWSSTILTDVDKQIALARRGQLDYRNSLQQAIATLDKRLKVPVGGRSTPPPAKRGQRREKPVKGYATQSQRFAKQQRRQALAAKLSALDADIAAKRVHVVEGGRKLMNSRHNLEAAGMDEHQWRQHWQNARWRINANGSPDEPFGNLTITVTPDGTVSVRLPKTLEYLANSARGRYTLDATATFTHQGETWRERITGRNSVSYTFTRKPGRAGVYLRAAWGTTSGSRWAPAPRTATTNATNNTPAATTAGGLPPAVARGEILGVDLNDGHLAVRHLEHHGNPVGDPITITVDLTGSSTRRDAQVRHAITAVINIAADRGVTAIAVEDLNFADARATGRETMGTGKRGKRFRRSVSGIPTSVFRNRMAAMCHRANITLYAVNPAYTSAWGGQHWQHPYTNVNRHQAAATVIGRRAQGFRGRRRSGVTDRDQRIAVRELPTRPPATPKGEFSVTGTRHPNAGNRKHNRTPRRATVTPAIGHPDRLME